MHAITTLKCSFPESGGFGGSEVYMGEISSKVLYRLYRLIQQQRLEKEIE